MNPVKGKMRDLLTLIASEPYRGTIDSSDTGRPHPLDPYVDDRGRDSDTDSSTTWLLDAGRAALEQGVVSETSPRAKAWATRRAKYGEAGHSGYRLRRSSVERRALQLIVRLHVEEVLSEGQCCDALEMDRVEFRTVCDEFNRVGSTLGEKIEIARKAAGLTQQDLADVISITRPQVANIEGGRSDVPTRRLIEIAAALGVSAGSLLP